MSESSPFLDSVEDWNEENEKDQRLRPQKPSKFLLSKASWALLSFAMLSMVGNVIQALLWAGERSNISKCPLPLTGLKLDNEVQFGRKTAYGEVVDIEATDRLWNSMNTNLGVVALPKQSHFGSTYGFPWDDRKGVYVLNSYHSLHCLQGIYRYVREYQQGKGDDSALGHIVHCLDVLRSDVMCTADDTPLSFDFQKPNMTEWPPKRKCRDWNKLQDFATSNSACFRRFSPSDPRYSTLTEFTYCPENSPYKSQAEKSRGLEAT